MTQPVSSEPFRSRRGRLMEIVMAVVSLVLFVVLALLVAGVAEGGWVVADRVMMVVIGVALAVALWQWASISAVPDESGITARNLVGRRHVAWEEIRDVTISILERTTFADLARAAREAAKS